MARITRLQLSQDFVPIFTTAAVKWYGTTSLHVMSLSPPISKV